MWPKWNPKNIYSEGVKEIEKFVHLHWIYCKKPIENDSKVRTNNWSLNVLKLLPLYQQKKMDQLPLLLADLIHAYVFLHVAQEPKKKV